MVRPYIFDAEDLIKATGQVELDRELGQRSMRDFMEIVWPIIEPGRPFMSNWHIDAFCDHYEAVIKGEITRLVVNVPPGCSKSITTCVAMPIWGWLQRPPMKFIFGGAREGNILRDSLKSKMIIESPIFKSRWGHLVKPGKKWSAWSFSNTMGGFWTGTTVEGTITGEHADIQVCDDPTKPLNESGTNTLSVSQHSLERAIYWWDQVMTTRLLPGGARIIIMQRLNEGDLAGHVLQEQGYTHLMLPMEFEPARKCYTSLPFEDPRTKPNELLCPDRFDEDHVASLKKELGAREAQAQLQQNPTPAGGTVFLTSWPNYYTKYPSLRDVQVQVQSWDCTFKEEGSSYVVGQVWGAKNEDRYLFDEIRDRLSFTDTCKAIMQMTLKWPKAHIKLVEEKANGNAIVDHLKNTIPGFRLITPEGGKTARANAVEPIWEGGNVYLPSPSLCPWITDWMDEVTGFPGRVHDDRVDAMTQALVYLKKYSLAKLRRAMENMR